MACWIKEDRQLEDMNFPVPGLYYILKHLELKNEEDLRVFVVCHEDPMGFVQYLYRLEWPCAFDDIERAIQYVTVMVFYQFNSRGYFGQRPSKLFSSGLYESRMEELIKQRIQHWLGDLSYNPTDLESLASIISPLAFFGLPISTITMLHKAQSPPPAPSPVTLAICTHFPGREQYEYPLPISKIVEILCLTMSGEFQSLKTPVSVSFGEPVDMEMKLALNHLAQSQHYYVIWNAAHGFVTLVYDPDLKFII
jgi:hypothetical protein